MSEQSFMEQVAKVLAEVRETKPRVWSLTIEWNKVGEVETASVVLTVEEEL